jgi:hypothetical protein
VTLRTPDEQRVWAFRQKVGNANRKLIFTALASYANEEGLTSVKSEDLAEYSECSLSSVTRHINALVDVGLIAIRRRATRAGRQPNEYLVHFPWIECWPDGERVPWPNTATVQNGLLPIQQQAIALNGCSHALTPARDNAVLPSEELNGGSHHQPLEQKSKSTTQKTRVNEGEYEALELALEVEEATPCWDLPVTDENWAPTYLGIDPDRVTIAAKYGIVWTPADHVRMVIDFWRDLLWHFDAAYTEEKLSVVKVALRAYPLEDSTMIIRAIIGGSKSAFHRGKNDRNKTYETLWHFLRIGKDGDKVDSFGRDIGELEVSEYIGIAEDNRKLFACWKAEMFEEVDDNWRFKNRVQLKKDSIGRYRRYEQWKGLARAS